MKRLVCVVIAALLVGCQSAGKPVKLAETPTTQAEKPLFGADDPQTWAVIAKTLGRDGKFGKEAYTVTIPRDDLWVNTDLGDIPTEAGLEIKLHFFKCPCGKTSVVGQFVVADYELNDVIDELQTDGILKIAGMSPMFLREKPRVMTVFFQGEGQAEKLAKIVKGALDYTGDRRMAPVKAPTQP
jgi:hypothetical protein